jgi:uncharacterized membrane protein
MRGVFERAALAGAGTGLRATVGLAALVLARADGLPTVLRQPGARAIALLAVGGELVVDKLPMTGSRLAPGQLAGRACFAGATGAALAGSEHASPLAAAAVAVCAALAAAKVGHDARAALSRHLPARVVAFAEDAVAIALAARAA